MDEINFNRDWELSESLNKLARDYLQKGATIDESFYERYRSSEE